MQETGCQQMPAPEKGPDLVPLTEQINQLTFDRILLEGKESICAKSHLIVLPFIEDRMVREIVTDFRPDQQA